MTDLQTEFGRLLSPKFTVTYDGPGAHPDPRPLLAALRQAKSSGTDFDWASNIVFSSATEAVVSFSWSGGFHGGQFIMRRTGDTWRIVDQYYLL